MATAKKTAPRKTVKKTAPPKAATAKKAPVAKKAPAAKKSPAAAKPAPKVAKAPSTTKASPSQGAAVDAFIAKMEPWQQDLARALSALVASVAPKASAYVKWGHPIWDHAGPFVLAKPAKAHLTIGLWRGGQLRDPDHILEGDGEGMRFVRLRSGQQLPASLATLLREAVALNNKLGDPLKR
ncbi:DUF1801 domain-containing protein [Myxococcaceae bacterium JPH2]|nr:DUF1801 domain-containing protein [Myxococcaceae bacterium JPH2]